MKVNIDSLNSDTMWYTFFCAEKVITPGSPLVGSNPQPTTLCLPGQTSDMLWLSHCVSRTPQRTAAIYSSSTIIFLLPPFCTTGLLLTFKGSIKKSASSLSIFFCAGDLWSSVSGRPRSISNFLCSTLLRDLWGRSSEWLLPQVQSRCHQSAVVNVESEYFGRCPCH